MADGDTGTVVVGINSAGLNLCAYDVAVDASSNIYVIQCLDGVRDPANYSMPRLFCFPPYTNPADLTTNWSVGSADYSLENAVGVAVDPTGPWVAVAVRGYNNGGRELAGIAKRRRQHLLRHQWRPGCQPGSGNQRRVHGRGLGQCWKSIYDRLERAVWRAYSPPGANQAVTVAVPVIQVYDTLTRPSLCAPAAPAGRPVRIHFAGQSNVTYVIECSPDWSTGPPSPPITTPFPSAPSPVAAPCAASFFQAVVP